MSDLEERIKKLVADFFRHAPKEYASVTGIVAGLLSEVDEALRGMVLDIRDAVPPGERWPVDVVAIGLHASALLLSDAAMLMKKDSTKPLTRDDILWSALTMTLTETLTDEGVRMCLGDVGEINAAYRLGLVPEKGPVLRQVADAFRAVRGYDYETCLDVPPAEDLGDVPPKA